MSIQVQFGRVDDDNNVFVFEHDHERKVGQYPGVSAEDALGYFTRKYDDFAAQVRILEQRVANKVDSHGMKKMAQKLQDELREAAAVGDLNDLRRRVGNLDEKISSLVAEKSEHAKEAIAASLEGRKAIAERAVKIADADPAKTQWKTSSAEMTKLFEQWQQLQKEGPRVPKGEADSVWKTFSHARNKFETNKRAYFSNLDTQNKATKSKKTSIVEAAEALAAKDSDDISAYRKLLDDWKTAGRTNGKIEDELWARFKAAGDKIYGKKSETAAVENAEFEKNLAAKLAILAEAASIDPVKDLAGAKKALLAIQTKWEKAGKVPKDKLRETEDKLRAIEKKVRDAEQEHWRKTDPAAIARTNGMIDQLQDAITKLEAELAKATAAKNDKKIKEATDALAARKAWLETVRAANA